MLYGSWCPSLTKPGCASLLGSSRYFHVLPSILPESLVIQMNFCSVSRVLTEHFPSLSLWRLSVRVSVARCTDTQSPTSQRFHVMKMYFLLTPQMWVLSEWPSTWSHKDAGSFQLGAHHSSGSPGSRQEFCIQGESCGGSRRRFYVSGL